MKEKAVFPKKLMKLELRIQECNNNSNVLCAAGSVPQIQGACQGDSGGPLMWFDKISG